MKMRVYHILEKPAHWGVKYLQSLLQPVKG